ncbi:MAG: hypothetical protein GX754_05690 [Clostridiaceae bacterium]|nr:hypothetical protein [Clostridiaceae bacterium]
MKINSTELQNNFGKYLQLAETQSIYIEKKGSDSIFKLSKVNRKEMLEEVLYSLYGCLRGTGLEHVNPEEIIYQRVCEKLNPGEMVMENGGETKNTR